MVEPGALKLLDLERATALVTTTEDSGTLPRNSFAGKTPRELALAFKPDKVPRVIAAALRGRFESAFTIPPSGAEASRHLQRSKDASASVFVIADIDWLFDPFSLQRTNVGDKVLVRPLNDTLAF